jgi:hypothetical protein
MLTARTDVGDGNFQRHYIVTGIDDETLAHAKSIFDGYHCTGVIQNSNFSDDEWMLTDQVRKTTLRFGRDELIFHANARRWIGCSYRCFVEVVKAYTVFHLGSLGLSGIRELVRGLLCLAGKSFDDLPEGVHAMEFLKLLPGGSDTRDQVIEAIEERLLFAPRKYSKHQRVLADFETYFRFNDSLEEFWSAALERERLFYFPVYFWWNLTAILPLRPSEFLLTPRQCLERQGAEIILSLRRTKMKGGGQKIRYSIDGDYKIVKYAVPEKMALEIERYQRATQGMLPVSLGTLFVHQPHYSYFSKIASTASVYYTYQNLSYCLRRFQENVMGVSEGESKINLGDTRHLAMISLIVSGGSPVICKELAGHEDINVSSHYYTNISRFVECATYEIYRKQRGGRVDMLEHRKPCAHESVPVNGGRCGSAVYIAGDITDCVRSIGPDVELGHCLSCQYFIDDKSGRYLLFSNPAERRKQVDEDSKYLMRVLEMVRKGKGCNEDIQSALLRLQHSSSTYSRCLYEKMGGLSWEGQEK